LFTPFFRSKEEQSREKNPNGNGLGLSICYKIAKSLNGDLTCNSTVGLGTIFTFSFMAETSSAELKKEKPMMPKKKKNGSKKEVMPLDVITEMVSQEDIDNVFREVEG